MLGLLQPENVQICTKNGHKRVLFQAFGTSFMTDSLFLLSEHVTET